MKFRKSRVVIVVAFLILISSVSYWLTYSSSHPRSDLSEKSFVDTGGAWHGHSLKYLTAGPPAEPQRNVKDTGYMGLYENRDRNGFHGKEVIDGHVGGKPVSYTHLTLPTILRV